LTKKVENKKTCHYCGKLVHSTWRLIGRIPMTLRRRFRGLEENSSDTLKK
jgi:hypothetical protein